MPKLKKKKKHGNDLGYFKEYERKKYLFFK